MSKILSISSIALGIFLIITNLSSLEDPITVFLLLLGFFGLSYGAVGLYRDSMKKKK